MKRRYVIQVGPNFVFRFSPVYQMVSMTASKASAKGFEDRADAMKFIYQYADKGYGLVRAQAEIVEA